MNLTKKNFDKRYDQTSSFIAGFGTFMLTGFGTTIYKTIDVYTDVVAKCRLDNSEPADQLACLEFEMASHAMEVLGPAFTYSIGAGVVVGLGTYFYKKYKRNQVE
ncbi:hypothetical protein ACFL1H_02055 [Nanoarchaeota archaeon]